MTPLFTCSIPGRVGIKKNRTQRHYSFRLKRTITMPSDKYLSWARMAMPYVVQSRNHADTISDPLEAHYRFYFKNRANEADVSNCIEGFADLMQKAGVIKDDRLIMRLTAEKFFGEEPRAEVELFPFQSNQKKENK